MRIPIVCFCLLTFLCIATTCLARKPYAKTPTWRIGNELFADADGVTLTAEQGKGGQIYQLKKNERVVVQKRKGLWLHVMLKETPKIQGWANLTNFNPIQQIDENRTIRRQGLERLLRGKAPIKTGSSPFTEKEMRAVEFFGNYKCSRSIEEFMAQGEIGLVRKGRRSSR